MQCDVLLCSGDKWKLQLRCPLERPPRLGITLVQWKNLHPGADNHIVVIIGGKHLHKNSSPTSQLFDIFSATWFRIACAISCDKMTASSSSVAHCSIISAITMKINFCFRKLRHILTTFEYNNLTVRIDHGVHQTGLIKDRYAPFDAFELCDVTVCSYDSLGCVYNSFHIWMRAFHGYVKCKWMSVTYAMIKLDGWWLFDDSSHKHLDVKLLFKRWLTLISLSHRSWCLFVHFVELVISESHESFSSSYRRLFNVTIVIHEQWPKVQSNNRWNAYPVPHEPIQIFSSFGLILFLPPPAKQTSGQRWSYWADEQYDQFWCLVASEINDRKGSENWVGGETDDSIYVEVRKAR